MRQFTSTLTTSTPSASSSSSAPARSASPEPRRSASSWKTDSWPLLASAGEQIAASATPATTSVRKRLGINSRYASPKNHAQRPRLRSAENLALRLLRTTGARENRAERVAGLLPTVELDPGNAGAEEG